MYPNVPKVLIEYAGGSQNCGKLGTVPEASVDVVFFPVKRRKYAIHY